MSRPFILAVACAITALGSAALLWTRGTTRDERSAAHPALATADAHAATKVELEGTPIVERPSAASAALIARLDAARKQPVGEARRAALIAALSEAAANEPAGAAQLAAELSEIDGRDEALHETLSHWLHSSPQASRAWLRANAVRLGGETTLVLAREVAAVDPALGLALAQTLPLGLRVSGVTDVFAEWAALDAARAARVASELTEKRDRRAAFAEIGRAWGHSDATAAYEWARQLNTAEERRVALEPLIASWTEADPAGAARAAAAAPPDLVRVRLLDSAAAAWAERDVEAALSWAESLVDPREREAAQTTVLLHLVQSRPEQAVERALRSNTGDDIVEKVFAAWDARDTTAAQRWQQHHPLHAQR